MDNKTNQIFKCEFANVLSHLTVKHTDGNGHSHHYTHTDTRTDTNIKKNSSVNTKSFTAQKFKYTRRSFQACKFFVPHQKLFRE